MKKLIVLACLGFIFSVSAPVFAGAQQDKMKGCNKEAKKSALKGDERKAFMSKCLKKDYILKSTAADPAEIEGDANAASGQDDGELTASAAEKSDQKGKMKSCNADAKAKDLKGAERKKFMSSCLKG